MALAKVSVAASLAKNELVVFLGLGVWPGVLALPFITPEEYLSDSTSRLIVLLPSYVYENPPGADLVVDCTEGDGGGNSFRNRLFF